jgi:hypothetical protein
MGETTGLEVGEVWKRLRNPRHELANQETGEESAFLTFGLRWDQRRPWHNIRGIAGRAP